jgi:hypothetical protein
MTEIFHDITGLDIFIRRLYTTTGLSVVINICYDSYSHKICIDTVHNIDIYIVRLYGNASELMPHAPQKKDNTVSILLVHPKI